jgi:hypothetical protein
MARKLILVGLLAVVAAGFNNGCSAPMKDAVWELCGVGQVNAGK